MARIPVTEMTPELWGDYSTMKYLQCAHHPEMEYLTKGPGRNLHLVGGAWPECACPYSDLVVITGPIARFGE